MGSYRPHYASHCLFSFAMWVWVESLDGWLALLALIARVSLNGNTNSTNYKDCVQIRINSVLGYHGGLGIHVLR